MTRKIKYKSLSKEMKQMVEPKKNNFNRSSIGNEDKVGEYYFFNINELEAHTNQARKSFNMQEIEDLAESIKQYGIRQPLTVVKNLETEKFEVISGERRLRAAKLLGLKDVPCIILKEHEYKEAIALIENIHRKDLTPIELGAAYKKLIEDGIFKTQEEIASKLSVSKGQISEYIKYANLPNNIKKIIQNNKSSSRNSIRQILKDNSINIDKKKTKKIKIELEIYKNQIKHKLYNFHTIEKEEKENIKKYLFEIINHLTT